MGKRKIILDSDDEEDPESLSPTKNEVQGMGGEVERSSAKGVEELEMRSTTSTGRTGAQ